VDVLLGKCLTFSNLSLLLVASSRRLVDNDVPVNYY